MCPNPLGGRVRVSNQGGKEMIYRISYEDGWAAIAETGAMRTEYFRTKHEALHRARELIESGVHHGVSMYDADGTALAGVRLQLKLGASAADLTLLTGWDHRGWGGPTRPPPCVTVTAVYRFLEFAARWQQLSLPLPDTSPDHP